MVLMDHHLKTSSGFLELVKLGPHSLPFLQSSLSDKRPTKLILKLEGNLQWMRAARELPGNLASPRERQVLSAVPKLDRDAIGNQSRLREHRVTVGDVCFVIVGQIVGRHYQAVRYQPSGGVIINSPTDDPIIAKSVRSIWAGKDSRKLLLVRLMLDYSTRGVADDVPLNRQQYSSAGSNFRSAAAMRMLYYFPRETVPVIAARLRALRVQRVFSNQSNATDDEMARWTHRELANGVRTDEFIKAVSWCKEPRIRSELLGVFKRASDPEVLLCVLPALDKSSWPLVRQRLHDEIWQHDYDDKGWYYNGYLMLLALGQFDAQRAQEVFRDYLKDEHLARTSTVLAALQEAKPGWSVTVLPVLFDDRRELYNFWQWRVRDDPNGHPVNFPLRVCDVAAWLVHSHRPDIKFELSSVSKDMDTQIADMKKNLAHTR